MSTTPSKSECIPHSLTPPRFALLFNSFSTKSKFSQQVLKKLIDLVFQVNQQALIMHSVVSNLKDLFAEWNSSQEEMIQLVVYILEKLDLNNNQDNVQLIQVLMDITDKNQILKYEKNLQQCLIYFINSNVYL